jgi:MFS family permease
MRRPALAAAITCVVTTLFAYAFLISAATPLAIGFFLLCGLMATAYNGPANGLLVTIAPPEVRGLTISILQFACNLVGMGVGPLIVGAVSESVGGVDGLRWGLMVIFGFNLLAAVQFLFVGRRYGKAAKPF